MTTTFGSLDTDPGFPARVSVIRATVSSAAFFGFVQRRQTQSSVSRNTNRREVRRWDLTWNTLDPTEFAEVSEAFDAAAGVGLPIDFTPPDEGAVIPVRFLSNEMRFQVRNNVHTMRATLEEVP